ncbi:MAG: hypothetical protein BGO79_21630 [Delftia sp. 67-8]|nr:MAG: hypothetical protein BGO79_21630 [Delftia sp. 67-8]
MVVVVLVVVVPVVLPLLSLPVVVVVVVQLLPVHVVFVSVLVVEPSGFFLVSVLLSPSAPDQGKHTSLPLTVPACPLHLPGSLLSGGVTSFSSSLPSLSLLMTFGSQVDPT